MSAFQYTFVFLFVVHLLGDFYLQTKKMAEKKKNEIRWVLYHSIIYGVGCIIFIKPILPQIPNIYIMVLSVSHAVIDIIKFYIWRDLEKRGRADLKGERNVFIIDQLVHVIVLLWVAYQLCSINLRNLYNREWFVFFQNIEVPEVWLLSWIFRILMIHKPANIMISKVIALYRPETLQGEQNQDKNAGRFIGTLERLIMTFFLVIRQYSAVGLVLTAKSIARYEKISKEQDFAEYYLIGTLLSTMFAVLVSLI